MIANTEVRQLVRNRLLGLNVATTGTTTLASTEQGYSRPAGSFVADGFVVGMEVVPSGFTDNTPDVITYVDATSIHVANGRTAETASAGRALNVGLPTKRGWEGFVLDDEGHGWTMEEQYVPGPGQHQVTVGPQGEVLHMPIYILRLTSPFGLGSSALYTVADAILDLFPPRYAFTLADGSTFRVRSQEGPYRTQAMQVDANSLFTNVYIPLWGRTRNSI